jgi:dTDP-4-dehydrorhamnose 3,5-epimerase
LIIGARGQLGRALAIEFPDAERVDRDTFDISNPTIISERRWRDYDTILNAAGYTAVDLAETSEGRRDAWLSNATALTNLVKIANENNITLVHVSSDYVFDGTEAIHTEDEQLSPLGVYAQSKAAGDLIVSTSPHHYVLRTSWVIGEGNNFVRTMVSLAERGIKPNVVNDQIGRLTFTEDLAKGIKHLIKTQAAYGTYNLSNDGEPVSWADIAKEVYAQVGKSADDITPVTTRQYYEGKDNIAPRPLQSTLDLTKITKVGFTPRDWRVSLHDYLNK